jgi:hypothetical protein
MQSMPTLPAMQGLGMGHLSIGLMFAQKPGLLHDKHVSCRVHIGCAHVDVPVHALWKLSVLPRLIVNNSYLRRTVHLYLHLQIASMR